MWPAAAAGMPSQMTMPACCEKPRLVAKSDPADTGWKALEADPLARHVEAVMQVDVVR